MSYSKTTWQTGDTVTADLLNHMEDGISSADAKELPAVSGSDNGKVLTVSSGAWSAQTPAGVPSYTSSDKNKVLHVNKNGNGLEWGVKIPNPGSYAPGYLSRSGPNEAVWYEPVIRYFYTDSTQDGNNETYIYNAWRNYDSSHLASYEMIKAYLFEGDIIYIIDEKYNGEDTQRILFPVFVDEKSLGGAGYYVIRMTCMVDSSGTLHVYKTGEEYSE